jgi:hypothetical protein
MPGLKTPTGSSKRAVLKVAFALGLITVLLLLGGCSSTRHVAYVQGGEINADLKARAREFVEALNTQDLARLQDLIASGQKPSAAAFLAAYGNRQARIKDFAPTAVGPDSEAFADIEIVCTPQQTIVLPQEFYWQHGNWRTYIYLPGQKSGVVTDQQC